MTYRLEIEDVFRIAGRGIVATGVLEDGVMHRGDALRIETQNGTVTAIVRSIEVFRKELDSAEPGRNIGVLLADLTGEIARGDIIRSAQKDHEDPGNPAPPDDIDTLRFSGAIGGGPIVLLPLRIETAFNGNQLQIRAFPDAVHIAADEQAITPGEKFLVDEFNAAVDRGEPAPPLRAKLEATMGKARTAFVFDQVASGQAVVDESTFSSVRAVARCLPHRLFATAIRDDDIIATAQGAKIPRVLPVGAGAGDHEVFGTSGPDELRWMQDLDAARNVGMALDLPLPDDAPIDRLVIFGLGPDARRDGDDLSELLAAHGLRQNGLTTPELGQPTKGGRVPLPAAPRGPSGPNALADALALGEPVNVQDSPEDTDLTDALAELIFDAALRPALHVLLDVDDAIAIGETSPALEQSKARFKALRAEGHLPVMRLGDDLLGMHIVALDTVPRAGFDPSAVTAGTRTALAAHARAVRADEAALPGYRPAISAFSRHDIGHVWRARHFMPPDQVLDALSNLAPDKVRSDAAQRAADAITSRLNLVAAAGGKPGDTATANGALFGPSAAQICGNLVGRDAHNSDAERITDPNLKDLLDGGPLWTRLEQRVQGTGEDPFAERPVSLLVIFAEHLIVRILAELEAAAQTRDPKERAALLGHGSFDLPEDGLASVRLALAAAQRLGAGNLRDIARQAARQQREPHYALAQLKALPDLLDTIAKRPPRLVHRAMAGLIDAVSTRPDMWDALSANDMLNTQRTTGDMTLSVGGFGVIEGPLAPGLGRSADDPRYVAAPTPTLATGLAVLWRAQMGLAWHDPGADKLIPTDLAAPAMAAARPLIEALRRGDDLDDTLAGYVMDQLQRAGAAGEEGALARHYQPRDAETTAASAPFDALAFLDDENLRRWPGSVPSAVREAHEDLRRAVDTLRQVLVAEGAAALAEGRPDAAAAALAGLGAGAAPPDDFVVTDPRATGPSVALSVTLVTDWAPSTSRATDLRSILAPELARLAQTLLGDISGHIDTDTGKRIALATLVGSPLELAWIMAAGQDGRRVLLDTAAERLKLNENNDIAFDTVAEDTLWMAERVHATLSNRRTLTPIDLGHLEPEGWRDVATTTALAQVRSRIQKWRNQLKRIRAMMDRRLGRPVPALDRILRNFGTQQGNDGAELLEKALAARLTAAKDAATQDDALRALLGDLPIVLPFALPAKTGLTGTARFKQAGPAALAHWIEDSGSVRETLEPISDLALTGSLPIRAVQWADGSLNTPDPGEDWIGGPMTEDDVYLAQGSSVVIGEVSQGSQPIAGLFLDGWSETLPARVQDLTVVLDVDAPRARAPQTALLGVRSDANDPWTPRDVLRLVRQTMDAAQVRTLTPADWPGSDKVSGLASDLGATLPLLMVEQGVAAVTAGFCDPQPEPDL